MPRLERRNYLNEHFHFYCNCEACSFTSISSKLLQSRISEVVDKQMTELEWEQLIRKEDQYRAKAMQLDSLILEIAENDSSCALDMAKSLVEVLIKPINQLWSVRYLADAYMYVYHIALSLDRFDQAHHALLEAHTWNRKLQGLLSPDSKRTYELLRLNGLSK